RKEYAGCFTLSRSTRHNRISGVNPTNFFFVAIVSFVVSSGGTRAQAPPQRSPDVSNKALITKSTPSISEDAFKNQSVSAATTARLKQMPALLKQGLSNLQNPVKLYAQLAIQSARSIDPLLNNSLMALDVDLAPNEHDELIRARDGALAAIHGYADELEKRLPKMTDFTPMGEA